MMRPLAVLLIAVTVISANDPPADAPGLERTEAIALDVPQDAAFGRILEFVQLDEMGNAFVTVKGRLTGFDPKDLPKWQTWDVSIEVHERPAGDRPLFFGKAKLEADGSFRGVCGAMSHTHKPFQLVRLGVVVFDVKGRHIQGACTCLLMPHAR
jgi:hypothetical protein